MEIFYLSLFAFSVLYAILSFLLGHLFSFAHIGSMDGTAHGVDNVHASGVHGEQALHAGSAHVGETFHNWSGHTDTGHTGEGNSPWSVSPWKPIVIVSFTTLFSGLGILGTRVFHWPVLVTFILSFLSGFFGSALLYRFVVIPLYMNTHSTAESRLTLIGMKARVISGILENGFGQIEYVVNELKCSAPARHVQGMAVHQGEMVTIDKIENNVFWVSTLEKTDMDTMNALTTLPVSKKTDS